VYKVVRASAQAHTSDECSNSIITLNPRLTAQKEIIMAFKPQLKVGLAAKLAAARAAEENALIASGKAVAKVDWAPAASVSERIGIIFDDSVSMSGQSIDDAREATIEFMRYCTMNQTAVGVYPLSSEASATHSFPLTTNLPALSSNVKSIQANHGSTPLYEVLSNTLRLSNPGITRAVVFSDGQPNGNDVRDFKRSAISEAIAQSVPVDTVFIANPNQPAEVQGGYEELKNLADKTGGHFLVYVPGKTQFKTLMKYLTPGLRPALSDGNFKAQLEAGQRS
jgi:Mg-chelatase subunit ChlD